MIVRFPGRASVFTIVLPLVLAGCGLRGDPEVFETPTYGEDVGETLSLEGVFAAQITFAQCVEQAVGSGYVLQSVSSYQLIDVSPGPGELEVTLIPTLCAARLTEVAGSTMTPSAGFVERNEDGPYVAQLSSFEVGATVRLDRQVELRGVSLDDPVRDTMPRDIDDPRLYDFDGNGNPGYSVNITGLVEAELWSIERMFLGLEGIVYSQDRVAGQLDGWLEDVFIYSSKPGLVPTDMDIQPIVHPSYSFFELRRLGSDSVDDNLTCEELLAQVDTIFPTPEARVDGDPCEAPGDWAPQR